MFDDYESALRRLAGGSLSESSALSVVHVAPRSRGAQVGFRVSEHNGDESLYYVEPVPRELKDEGVVTTTPMGDGVDVVAWKYPADPRLPALPTVVFPEACATLLQRMGRPSDITDLTLVGYRPGRRAVVRVTTPKEVLFIKVVRPSQVEDLVRKHRTAFDAGVPTPRVMNWSSAGFFVLALADGTPLIDAARIGLSSDDVAERIRDAQSLMTHVTGQGPARTPIINSYEWYFDQAERFLPDIQDDLMALRAQVSELIARSDPGPAVTIHGDLHAGQIFVSPRWPHPVTALVDLDGIGMGFAIDDSAAACAHALATGILSGTSELGALWSEVASVVSAMVGSIDAHRRRFAAGVITHLVGHALNAHTSGQGDAHALVEASQRFL